MRLSITTTISSFLLLFLTAAPAHAVFHDEVNHIDFHHELLGVPQQTTTFFHRPRREEKASLLYTLSDVGVLGAVNPSNGAVVWRQFLAGDDNHNSSASSGHGGFLRAAEGESCVVGAFGKAVHAWNALTGRNIWWMNFVGEVRDVEVMEMTESERKDVLALFEEDGATVLRRLHGTDGSVVWEFKDSGKDVPLQVSTNIEKVFVVSLHGSPSSYSIKVSVLDTKTGKRADEMILGTKGDVHSEKDVMFVGANSASPIVAWTDDSVTKLKVNVLGTKAKQEFPLTADTVSVDIHAPHLLQSESHFLVHSRTKTGNRADVYHVNLKNNAIVKAYELPHLPGLGAFSTSSEGANVWFTRMTEEEIILTSSTSHGILARFPFKAGTDIEAIHAVSEVVKKSADSYAVRSAALTTSDHWIMVRNGETAWTRPEGLTAAVAAAWAEIPESEDLAKTLEEEAHINPLSAYIHRVNRHINDLQYLPDYLASIPQRLINSVLGKEPSTSEGSLVRDGFGFNKIAVLATSRGKLYCLDTGNHGNIVWSTTAFKIPPGEKWDVKGIFVEDSKGQVTVRGAHGEYVVVKTDTGKIVEVMPLGSLPPVQSAVVVDSPSGPWLLPVGKAGKVGDLPAAWAPKQTVVVLGEHGELKGLNFVPKGDDTTSDEVVWTFTPPSGFRIVNIAMRPSHDPVASIGRVLGDRRVQYKYLNPNIAVIAAINAAQSVLSIYLIDTVSGQVLSSASHQGVSPEKPIACTMAENWYTCSFFGAYSLKDGSSEALKGYQIVVTDLYESDIPNDRGPLGDAANFSSLNPIDTPTGPAIPAAISQAFVVSSPIASFAVTQTRQGISSRQILAYLPYNHAIAGFPRQVLEPRRPVGRDATPAEAEAEALVKYQPAIEIDPRNVITHERDVVGVKGIITTATIVESTSLVLAYGIDIFGTRVAPSFTFDILGKGFSKISLVGTVLALMAGVMALGPMVSLSISLPVRDCLDGLAVLTFAGEEEADQYALDADGIADSTRRVCGAGRECTI
jgi:ER membrane protein complex subunit 1